MRVVADIGEGSPPGPGTTCVQSRQIMRLRIPALLALALLPVPLPAAPPASDRSTEVVRLECASDLGRREVTLFGNGTVRLREGLRGKEEALGLAELDPAELAGALARLA